MREEAKPGEPGQGTMRRARAVHGTRRRVEIALVFLTIAAALIGMLQFAASANAAAARRALGAADPIRALAAARTCLQLYPWSPQALHTANVVRKRQGAWRAIAEDCAAARAWNEDAVTIARLEAEANWQLGEKASAGDAAWRALALEPMPRRSPSQIWRIAMLGSAAAEEGNAVRTRTAAWFVLATLEGDAETPEAIKAATRGEAEKLSR